MSRKSGRSRKFIQVRGVNRECSLLVFHLLLAGIETMNLLEESSNEQGFLGVEQKLSAQHLIEISTVS